MKKKLFTCLLPVCFSMLLFSQSDISMETQWNNRGNYNPASIARTDYIYLFSSARKQWLGINGSPAVLNIQASVYDHSLKSAFGISVINDEIGLNNALNSMFNYAYRISDNRKWSLSFGLSVGVFHRTIDVSRYSPVNDADRTLYNGAEPITKPDANAGLEFQNEHFIFGASTTHILSINKPDNLYLNANHRYIYGIYKNTSSVLFNYYIGLQLLNHANVFVAETNTVFRFKVPTGVQSGDRELFDVGFTYRTSNQLAALFGVNVTNNFRVGYAYDQTFRTGYNQNGTHEIMMEYRIPLKSAECETCRDQQLWYR